MEEENIIPFYLQRPKETPPPQEQPNPYAALQEQERLHEEHYKQDEAHWKKTYDDLVAEKANLYKADPKLAEVKRKEAAFKTLVGAFGSLADTIAVHNGGTAPLRDYRADIYQTHQQADAIDQSERAKESAAYQKWLDRLEKLVDKRPKWTKNDAAIQHAILSAKEQQHKDNKAFKLFLQEKQDDAAWKRVLARIGADKDKQKNDQETDKYKNTVKIPNPLNNGEVWLDKEFLNKVSIPAIVQQIIDEYGVSDTELQKIKEKNKAILDELLEDDEISLAQYQRLYREASDNKYTESDLGRLLQMYPDAVNILMQHDIRGGDYTKPIINKKDTTRYQTNGVDVVNFKTQKGAADPNASRPETTYDYEYE
jgi:hypothetical protein